MPTRQTIEAFFGGLQNEICQQLETAEESARFREDLWDRPGGGGGRARVLQGQVIEKGGVNFSVVHGALPTKAATALGAGADTTFYATGVSIVLHPHNPLAPIIHMNVRYFEMVSGEWWFGGGIDLTPHYVFPEDARWFHRELKRVCDRTHPDYYARFKTWADDYFYLPHRQETRGVGGIFFDRLGANEALSPEELFAFVRGVGEAFAPIYLELLRRRAELPFEAAHQDWQRVRRGRYVEFNLVWDRGTKFGLETNGRTESILMSLPPLASWQYDYQPEVGSAEATTLAWLRKGVEWV